jgi:NitT/TauT family transport system ATP-binding protein
MERILVASHLSRRFRTRNGAAVQALDDVSLTVGENDFVCIIGPSGCGKSTLLRIIAGLETPDTGQVMFRGQPVTRPDPEIGMVFQEYSLFPWLQAVDNVAAGRAFAGTGKKKRRALAAHYLDVVSMSEFAHAYPHELSGGMRQRVAIARAFANDPQILLMDEPFGSLDAHTRILLQKELLRIWQSHRKTVLFVTHSVDEAIYLADRIVIMSTWPGRVREIIDVDMARPRRRSDAAFGRMADHLLHLLEIEVTGLQNRIKTRK